MLLIVFYLAAIVAANLSVAAFGPGITILNAFLFIAFDLTTRDALHERWQGRNLWLKMLALIGAGSLLSAALNANAGSIALASFVAFLAAGIVDTAMYTLLGDHERLVKVNGSNVVSAAVDSFLFPVIAFGAFMPGIFIGQWLAKVAGGFVWSWVMFRNQQEHKFE